MENVPAFPYIYQIAHAVHDYIKAPPLLLRHLHLQPMNYQTPKRTSWWLVPSNRVPFYQYSKLFFHYIPDYSRRIIAGFSFDRGLGGQLQGLVDTSLLLRSDWYWRRFLNDVMAGVFNEPLRMLALKSGVQPLLIIELYDFNRLHRRSLETNPASDTLVLHLPDGTLDSLSPRYPAKQQLKSMEGIHACQDLALHIEMNPDYAFYWMRFTFGVELPEKYTKASPENTAGLWHDVLSPWSFLVR